MTTREQAIQWWNAHKEEFGVYLQVTTNKYFKNREIDTLTGSEIEIMWKSEFLIEKEYKTEENNIYLNRLKEQYKQVLSKKEGIFYLDGYNRLAQDYLAMRLFCLDTQLVSFNDIEVMENEVNQSFL